MYSIEISFKFSELDNENKFGIVLNSSEGFKDYDRWIYFYLGEYFAGTKPKIYPFKVGKIVKEYKYCNDAKRQAKLIFNAIQKINNAKL